MNKQAQVDHDGEVSMFIKMCCLCGAIKKVATIRGVVSRHDNPLDLQAGAHVGLS